MDSFKDMMQRYSSESTNIHHKEEPITYTAQYCSQPLSGQTTCEGVFGGISKESVLPGMEPKRDVSTVDTTVKSSLLNRENTWRTRVDTLSGNLKFDQVCPQKNGREKMKKLRLRLRAALIANKCYDVAEFHKRKATNREFMEVYVEMYNNSFDKTLESECKFALSVADEVGYGFLVKQFKSELTPFEHNIKNWYRNQFRAFGIKKSTLKQMITIMAGRGGKRNTIYLVGSASVGKTRIAELLCSPFELAQEGTIPSNIGSIKSSFWLQDTLHKRVYRCEEMTVTVDNADTVKMLFEGNPSLKSDIKYAGSIRVMKRPVIVTCNEHIWESVPSVAPPIKERILEIPMFCTEQGERSKRFDYEMTRENQRHVLAEIYSELIDNTNDSDDFKASPMRDFVLDYINKDGLDF